MPRRPPSYCTYPGCKALVAKGRCPEHRTDWQQQRQRRQQDRDRGTRTQRGYDADWQALRLAHLADEPLCRFCRERGITKPAEVVDHIIPISERPDLRLVRSNLRSLCKTCHDRHTARTQGFARPG